MFFLACRVQYFICLYGFSYNQKKNEFFFYIQTDVYQPMAIINYFLKNSVRIIQIMFTTVQLKRLPLLLFR